jgi:hypothetical protein
MLVSSKIVEGYQCHPKETLNVFEEQPTPLAKEKDEYRRRGRPKAGAATRLHDAPFSALPERAGSLH